MIQFFAGRRLKRMDVAALWIHAGHHVLDGAVLARRVHPLKDQQQRPAILSVELLLHLARQGTVLFRQFLRVLLGFHSLRFPGVEVFQMELATLRDAKRLGKPRRFFNQFSVVHKPAV